MRELERTAVSVVAGTPAAHADIDAFDASEKEDVDRKAGAVSPAPGREPWEDLFQLGPQGLSEERRAAALKAYEGYASTQRLHFLGYQADQKLDYSADLTWMLDYHINNVGDPFTDGNFTLNSKVAERQVLDYYARLWHAKLPHDPKDPESYWGYALTMGSTEGNLYGMWNARDYLSGKALIARPQRGHRPPRLMWVQGKRSGVPDDAVHEDHSLTPVAFYSEDTHYSLTKAMRVLGIPTFFELGTKLYPKECPLGGPWPEEVPSLAGPSGRSTDGPGQIDVKALEGLVRFFANKGYPILLCLNYGTTFKGAYDPVEAVIAMLKTAIPKDLFEREIECEGHKEKRYGFWVHVDGALGAAYMPFLKMAQDEGTFDKTIPVPPFDFGLDYVFSIAMSGHKWIGAPWPCGVFMTKVKYQLRPPSIPVYVGSPDTTFAGSRSGFSPLIFWDYLAKHSHADQKQMACAAQEVASYAELALLQLGQRLKLDLYVARTPLALTVRFRKPVDALVHKYSLSTEEFENDPLKRQYAHIFLMPGITREKIDELVADLSKPGAFEPGPSLSPSKLETPVAAVEADDKHHLALVPTSGRGFR